MKKTVFQMVSDVLSDAEEKLASDQHGISKEAAATPGPTSTSAHVIDSAAFDKIAEACDYVSENFHAVMPDPALSEKLAEFALIQSAVKTAMEGGEKKHQTTQANPESIPSETTVTLDDSGTGVGAGNAVPTNEVSTTGTSLDAGESGQATGGNQPPKSPEASEKAFPTDAGNALGTNKDMMMAEQPEEVLKQAAAALRAEAAQIREDLRAPDVVKQASLRQISEASEAATLGETLASLFEKAASSNVTPEMALMSIKMSGNETMAKVAEDALSPAKISSGTAPELQSAAEAPSALSQGTEAGEATPRETAPTSGEASGRQHLSSNEAAINYTKGQAKKPNVTAAMDQLLNEPAMSSAHDKVLQTSLDNTSSAGVKISAATELLSRFAGQSPEHAEFLGKMMKEAEEAPTPPAGDPAMPPAGMPQGMPQGMPPSEAPMDEGLEQPPELGAAAPGEEQPPAEGGPTAEALEAAASGVTPEDLAIAEALLAQAAEQEAAAQAAGAEAGGDPAAEATPPVEDPAAAAAPPPMMPPTPQPGM